METKNSGESRDWLAPDENEKTCIGNDAGRIYVKLDALVLRAREAGLSDIEYKLNSALECMNDVIADMVVDSLKKNAYSWILEEGK